MTILFDRAWEILEKNRMAYWVLSGFYYGLIAIMMLYSTFNSSLQNQMLATNRSAYMTGALSLPLNATPGSEILPILGFAFLTNVLGANYGGITLPSFVIPFIGILLGFYRAIILGIFFSPFHAEISPIILAHLPTLLIEGQATILAMLGAYIHGRATLWPSSVGQTSRWKAYIEGVRQSGTLYMYIIIILFISAIYGLIEAAILIK